MSIFFSSAEWALLDQHQKHLYEEVMMDNYENVAYLGKGSKWRDAALEDLCFMLDDAGDALCLAQ